MKTILTLGLILISTLISLAGNNPNDKVLTIEGKFIAESSIRYEVYLVNDTVFTLESKGHSLKYFNINVEVGEQYLIKFIAKDGKTKYLYLDAPEDGVFMVNVDFTKDGSARLDYNHKKAKYNVTLIDNYSMCNVKSSRTY